MVIQTARGDAVFALATTTTTLLLGVATIFWFV
jgi:hypothetical protein